MTLEGYYYVYSAMTQAIGSLIALVGIFIIFRIQLQRERIRDSCISIANLGHWNNDFSEKEITSLAEAFITSSASKMGDIKIVKAIENELINKTKQHEIMEYTIKQGEVLVIHATFLFIYYIFILHFHSCIFYSAFLRKVYFVLGITLTVLVVFRIFLFIRKSIYNKDNKFTAFLSRCKFDKIF
jgi:hypothetical protein